MLPGKGIGTRYLYLVPYAWAILVMVFAIRYAFPQTDDFCTFGRLFGPSGDNPFVETWSVYHSWTGRYASTFLITAVGWLSTLIPVPLQQSYRGALVLFFATYLLSCFIVSRVVSGRRRGAPALALIVASATLVLMPSKLEEFIWLTGAAVYFVSLALLLLLIGMIDQPVDVDDEGSSRPLSWSVVALLIAGVGINEFIALAIGGFLLLRFAFYAHGRTFRKQNLIYLLIYLAALAVTIFAPGNFARDAGVAAPHHSLEGALELALASFSIFVDMHVRPNIFLLVCLVIVSLLSGFEVYEDNRGRRNMYRILAVSITLVGSFPMHLFDYSFLSGEETPGRIINEAYPLALIGVCVLASYLGARLRDRFGSAPMAVVRLCICAVGIVLVSSPQLRQVVTVIRDFGPTWNAEQLARIDMVKQAAREKVSVTVPEFSREGSTPPLLQGADIDGDKAYWVNQCVASFYSVPSIETSPRSR